MYKIRWSTIDDLRYSYLNILYMRVASRADASIYCVTRLPHYVDLISQAASCTAASRLRSQTLARVWLLETMHAW